MAPIVEVTPVRILSRFQYNFITGINGQMAFNKIPRLSHLQSRCCLEKFWNIFKWWGGEPTIQVAMKRSRKPLLPNNETNACNWSENSAPHIFELRTASFKAFMIMWMCPNICRDKHVCQPTPPPSQGKQSKTGRPPHSWTYYDFRWRPENVQMMQHSIEATQTIIHKTITRQKQFVIEYVPICWPWKVKWMWKAHHGPHAWHTNCVLHSCLARVEHTCGMPDVGSSIIHM